jgi:hypothetical protein
MFDNNCRSRSFTSSKLLLLSILLSLSCEPLYTLSHGKLAFLRLAQISTNSHPRDQSSSSVYYARSGAQHSVSAYDRIFSTRKCKFVCQCYGAVESDCASSSTVELREAVGHFARSLSATWSAHAEPLQLGTHISGMFVEVSEKCIYVLVQGVSSTAPASESSGKGSDLFWNVHCAGRRADVGHAALLLHLQSYRALAVGGAAVKSLQLVSGCVDITGAHTIKCAQSVTGVVVFYIVVDDGVAAIAAALAAAIAAVALLLPSLLPPQLPPLLSPQQHPISGPVPRRRRAAYLPRQVHTRGGVGPGRGRAATGLETNGGAGLLPELLDIPLSLTHARTHARMHARTHVRTRTRTHTHTHAHAHTHRPFPRRAPGYRSRVPRRPDFPASRRCARAVPLLSCVHAQYKCTWCTYISD